MTPSRFLFQYQRVCSLPTALPTVQTFKRRKSEGPSGPYLPRTVGKK